MRECARAYAKRGSAHHRRSPLTSRAQRRRYAHPDLRPEAAAGVPPTCSATVSSGATHLPVNATAAIERTWRSASCSTRPGRPLSRVGRVSGGPPGNKTAGTRSLAPQPRKSPSSCPDELGSPPDRGWPHHSPCPEAARGAWAPGMHILQWASSEEPALRTPPSTVSTPSPTRGRTTTTRPPAGEGPARVRARVDESARGWNRSDDPSWVLIELALSSRSRLAIVQAQDVLGLGSKARMNTPSTFGRNWRWRLEPGQLTAEHAVRLREATRRWHRLRS
jgi:hypothetical protein